MIRAKKLVRLGGWREDEVFVSGPHPWLSGGVTCCPVQLAGARSTRSGGRGRMCVNSQLPQFVSRKDGRRVGFEYGREIRTERKFILGYEISIRLVLGLPSSRQLLEEAPRDPD